MTCASNPQNGSQNQLTCFQKYSNLSRQVPVWGLVNSYRLWRHAKCPPLNYRGIPAFTRATCGRQNRTFGFVGIHGVFVMGSITFGRAPGGRVPNSGTPGVHFKMRDCTSAPCRLSLKSVCTGLPLPRLPKSLPSSAVSDNLALAFSIFFQDGDDFRLYDPVNHENDKILGQICRSLVSLSKGW